MSDALLSVSGLTTIIGTDLQPVCDIHFELHAGETLALLGESGCGKSMTAFSVMRLLPPAARIKQGSIRLAGLELLSLSERDMRRQRGGQMSMIFQEPMTSLNPVLTIGQQIGEAIRLHDQMQPRQISKRAIELLDQVGIADPAARLQEYPHQLSGGMKQRVMIAIALAGRPKLLIADEPTTALDVTIQAQVLTLLRDLQRETGMAILLITHDLGVVAENADRVAVMYAGQLIETATADAFFAQPKHPYSQRLFEAIPSLARRQQSLTVIAGQVPALNERFRGCRFVQRCHLAQAECRTQLPPWQGSDQTGYLCHLATESERTVGQERQLAQAPILALPQSTNTVLEVRDLVVHFPIRKGIFRRVVGHVQAVNGIDFSIQSGKTLALVGESGCGKTTVGKSLLQLIRPTRGSVKLQGLELTALGGAQLRQQRRAIQMIFQDPAASMNPRMTVEAIMSEGLLAQKIGASRAERQAIAIAMLERVGLSRQALQRYPHEFSGGQRQRIAIARALVLQPQLLVCDEPTSALDLSVQAQILNILNELRHEFNVSYLFITHNIAVLSYLADDLAVMYLGRIVERGAVSAVLAKPLHPYTQALLAAVPRMQPAASKTPLPLSGDTPSPSNPPSGCHFHSRCPRAMAECQLLYPAWHKVGQQEVACHLYAP